MEKIVLPDIKDIHILDVYVNNSGFEAAKKAFSQSPDDIIDQVKIRIKRKRRCCLFSRLEMEFHAQDHFQTEIFMYKW